jgi:hypothetical protein
MIMCATCLKVIDTDVAKWTVQKLQTLKADHEAIYTGAIDLSVGFGLPSRSRVRALRGEWITGCSSARTGPRKVGSRALSAVGLRTWRPVCSRRTLATQRSPLTRGLGLGPFDSR